MAASASHKRRRNSKRGCVNELASLIVEGKKTVIITGAGLSVASGVRPFRGVGGVWSSVLYEKSTRHAFRKCPLEWYQTFWLPQFVHCESEFTPEPNAGHLAIESIVSEFSTGDSSISLITQNIDGLHISKKHEVIQAHGRLGLYKCIPDSDSDTDSDDDEDDDRLVHLGHRRKSRSLLRAYYKNKQREIGTSRSCRTNAKRRYSTRRQQQRQRRLVDEKDTMDADESSTDTATTIATSTSSEATTSRIPCRYELVDSIPLNKIQPPSVRPALLGKTPLLEPPRCPECNRPCPPQALLFDEGYHSHSLYQFEQMEKLLADCEVLVFVGTSFSGVRITQVALEHARTVGLRVYNFNTKDTLQHSTELNVQNVVGPAQETLPRLLQACRELKRVKKEESSVGEGESSGQEGVNAQGDEDESIDEEDHDDESPASVEVHVEPVTSSDSRKRRGKRERDPTMVKRRRRCKLMAFW